MSLEERVLRRIVPTPAEEERLQAAISILKTMLESEIKKLGVEAHPMLVGSVAKGTHLKNPEVDMFICFPSTTPREDLERLGLMLGESVLSSPERHFAEHPYLVGKFEGFDTEIVPCYEIRDPTRKISAVDRTPFHTSYILSHLKEEQKNEVRLLKRFAKGIGVYGAEARVRGLSGYLCELLVLKYESFRKVLRGATRWRKGIVLELEGKADKSFSDPLVFIDPVDPSRNVASALSLDQFARFIYLSKSYLANPRMGYFFPRKDKKPTKARVRQMMSARGTDVLAIVLKRPDVVDDILYPQIWKAIESIRKVLEDNEFKVISSGCSVLEDSVLFLIELVSMSLPPVKKHMGPAPWMKTAIKFVEKWKKSRRRIAGPYIEDGHLYFDLKREYTHAKSLLKKEMKTLSIGKSLERVASRGCKVLLNQEILAEGFVLPLSHFLEKFDLLKSTT